MVNIIHVAAGVIEDSNGLVLVSLRAKDSHQGGLWEFPGGKLELGESSYDGLVRELREELAIAVHSARPLISIKHDYGDKQVLLDVWRITNYSGQVIGNEGQQIKWHAKQALDELAMPEADVAIVRSINLPSFYAITPAFTAIQEVESSTVEIEHEKAVAKLIKKNIKLIQLRDHGLSHSRYLRLAQSLRAKLSDKDIQFMVNCDLNSAIEIGADGIHLSVQRVQDYIQKNVEIPRHLLTAVSCHNREELLAAQQFGADFAVLGPVKRTSSHLQRMPLGWQAFSAIVKDSNIPVYALGGLTEDDLSAAYNSGAQGIAAISAFQT